jgi:hypothetical protein
VTELASCPFRVGELCVPERTKVDNDVVAHIWYWGRPIVHGRVMVLKEDRVAVENNARREDHMTNPTKQPKPRLASKRESLLFPLVTITLSTTYRFSSSILPWAPLWRGSSKSSYTIVDHCRGVSIRIINRAVRNNNELGKS